MAWKLAPSLAALFDEINRTWPNRDKSTDGTVGDTSHQARKSEHNPNRDPDDDVPDGLVTAADIDKDGINTDKLMGALIGDSRVWYVIFDRHIYSRTYDWAKRNYTGSNPHTGHIHVSLRQTRKACEDTGTWGLYEPKSQEKETPYQRVKRIAHQRRRRIKNLIKRVRRLKRR